MEIMSEGQVLISLWEAYRRLCPNILIICGL